MEKSSVKSASYPSLERGQLPQLFVCVMLEVVILELTVLYASMADDEKADINSLVLEDSQTHRNPLKLS